MAEATHAPSLYAAAGSGERFARLNEPTRATVAIIGGGYTGLSAALHLAERGVDTILLEEKRVGWGASGRNGGQLHTGQRRDQDWLEATYGADDALRFWNLAEEAKALLHELLARHRIDAGWRPGLIEAVHKQRLLGAERTYVDKLRDTYGYDRIRWLDRDALSAALATDVYHGGYRDMGAGHLDPLAFARGLARAASAAGARIHEDTKVTAVNPRAGGGFEITCAPPDGAQSRGKRPAGPCVTADVVILAGNGYLNGIDGEVEARVMPIANYILATDPIGAGKPGGIIPGGEAVSDTRFVVYYFRPSPDGRLIFGGGESYGTRAPADIGAFVRRHLGNIYPQLANARAAYAWGGTLAITLPRMPYIRRVRPGFYAAAGYSGQGVALAPFAGKVLAEAILRAPGKLDTFAALRIPAFPGGRLLRKPALVAGMLWYALRDRL